MTPQLATASDTALAATIGGATDCHLLRGAFQPAEP